MRSLIVATCTLVVSTIAAGRHTESNAATPNQCRVYAQSAVAQYNNMRRVAKCRVGNNPRWQPSYKNHYNWCLKAPDAWLDSERGARVIHLSNCGGGGNID